MGAVVKMPSVWEPAVWGRTVQGHNLAQVIFDVSSPALCAYTLGSTI